MTSKPRLTPEAEHLAEQERLLEELTEQLAEREAEFAETGSAFARFRAEYLRRFAPLYAELDRLEAEIARRIAVEEDTTTAHEKAAEAAARADESQQALDDGKAIAEDAPEESGPVAQAPELKALYRDAAKKVHPDLATDPEEKARRTALMAALNAAYNAGDTAAIERILDGEAARPEAITGDDIGARLMRTIRKVAQVRGRFTELVELNGALRSDPLFVLFEQCRADWEAGDDALAEDEASLRERMASAHARLAALVMAAAKRSGRPRG
jgi:hypothetical protein